MFMSYVYTLLADSRIWYVLFLYGLYFVKLTPNTLYFFTGNTLNLVIQSQQTKHNLNHYSHYGLVHSKEYKYFW